MPARSHGMSKTPTYSVWCDMRKRCENKNNKSYPDYGGRGIKVCKRWLKFENFFEDMGLRPSPRHEITRLDNDGIYEPDNCQWSDNPIGQIRNRRTHKNHTSSRYRGGDLWKAKGWRARITIKLGDTRYIGTFKTEVEAAEAYDAVARLYRGFILNFPQTGRL